MNNIKQNIANNIYKLRVKNKLTQAELGEKLNYSDKSVSKWERGDVTPSIEVLCEISSLFNISLDVLTSDLSDGSYDKIYSSKRNFANKVIITLLAVSIVWLLATMLFVYSSFYPSKSGWVTFVVALPLSVLILIIFNFIWGKRKFTFILISLFIWSILATIYLCLFTYSSLNPWAIFIIGVPLQIATILWSQLKKDKIR